MALITCPECGNQVSDNTSSCSICGHEFSPQLPSGGADHNAQPLEAPPAETAGKPNAQEGNSSALQNYKKRRRTQSLILLIVGCVGLLSVILVFFGVRASIATYKENLASVFTDLNAEIDGVGQYAAKVLSVWGKAIANGNATEEDVEEALDNLFSDADFAESIRALEERRNNIRQRLDELENPPREMTRIYYKLDDLYRQYVILTGMIIAPKGDFREYTEKMETTIDKMIEILEEYSRLVEAA